MTQKSSNQWSREDEHRWDPKGPPQLLALEGAVTDDGKIYSTPTLTWTVDSGPGTVTFGTPNAASTTATFSAAGTYVLRLNAFHGELNGTATVSATVNPAPILNQAPVVSISPVSPITLPAGAGLMRHGN